MNGIRAIAIFAFVVIAYGLGSWLVGFTYGSAVFFVMNHWLWIIGGAAVVFLIGMIVRNRSTVRK